MLSRADQKRSAVTALTLGAVNAQAYVVVSFLRMAAPSPMVTLLLLAVTSWSAVSYFLHVDTGPRPGLAAYRNALLASAVALLAYAGAAALVNFPPTHSALSPRPGSLTLVINGVILVPVVEELLFRGYLYRALELLWSKSGAVVVSTVVFGGVHLLGGPRPAATALMVGLLLGLLRSLTGRIVAPVMFHVVWNSIYYAAAGS